MTTFFKEAKSLSPGELVTLWDIDTTSIGGDTVYHFTDCTISGAAVVFNGVTYAPIDLKYEGFNKKTDGNLPTPTLTVANQTLTFAAISESYNNLINAKVTRRVTLGRFLDGQPDADSYQQRVDSFYVTSIVSHNKYQLTWKLKTIIDFEKKLLPKQQILNRCGYRYRYYEDAAFVYPDPGCPYTGGSYFTVNDTTTSGAANDACSKTEYACSLRYPGDDTVRPYNGFPGVGKVSRMYR